VNEGDLLVTLSAPEMEAQVAESEAKVKAAESAAAEARARLVAAESTYERLSKASATEGAVSGQELQLAKQAAEAARDAARAAEASAAAAKASVGVLKKVQQYLDIRAPFSGVITERMAHPGTLAGPATGPLLRLEQVARLRLVVAVPEADFGGVRAGAKVPFQVAAFPNRTFTGVVARVAPSVDPKTRKAPVELDVANESGAFAPGMYAEVNWPARSAEPALLAPATSIVRTTERVFVIRVRNGRAEWVNVRPGFRDGGLVQVFGDLRAGDAVVKNASDEIRDGAELKSLSAASN
jgi:RND family efflux transporter MFP subunit